MSRYEPLRTAAAGAPPQTSVRIGRDHARAIAEEALIPCAAVRRLNEILSSNPVDLSELGTLGRASAAVSEQVLKLVHSSLFNLPRPASNLEQAVVAIGAENVRTLALACELVTRVAAELPAENAGVFWRHSFATALFSQRIAQCVLANATEQAYLAGFLHDAGRIPLILRAREESKPSASPAERWTESTDAEVRDFGISHCEIGRDLGLRWGFPLSLVEVFAFHHDAPSAPPEAPLVRIVSAADEFANQKRAEGQGAASDSTTRLETERIIQTSFPGLNPKMRSALIDSLESEYAAAARSPRVGFASSIFTAP